MQYRIDSLDAIVLAGGINHIELFKGYKPGYKSLLPIAGKPSIQYTLNALKAVPQIKRVCIVGPERELREAIIDASSYDFATTGETLKDSIFIGLERFMYSQAVLITTGDAPLITPDSIVDFIQGCGSVEKGYDQKLFISAVAKKYFTGTYERSPKKFTHFKETDLCHGNLMITRPRDLINSRLSGRINRLYSARKVPFKTAMAFGWSVGFVYLIGVRLLRLLSIQHMARFASWRFGVEVVPVLLKHPEITIDIDEPEDYAFVKNLLESSSN